MLEALCDRVIPPEGEERAEIAPWIDAASIRSGRTGTRYDGMPDNPSAWRSGLAALDAEARARDADGFAAMATDAQDAMLQDIDDGETQAAEAGTASGRRSSSGTPRSSRSSRSTTPTQGQSEIGYGGPASPRGYVRLGADRHRRAGRRRADNGPTSRAKR